MLEDRKEKTQHVAEEADSKQAKAVRETLDFLLAKGREIAPSGTWDRINGEYPEFRAMADKLAAAFGLVAIEIETEPGASVLAGMRDALAYARGDKSRGKDMP